MGKWSVVALMALAVGGAACTLLWFGDRSGLPQRSAASDKAVADTAPHPAPPRVLVVQEEPAAPIAALPAPVVTVISKVMPTQARVTEAPRRVPLGQPGDDARRAPTDRWTLVREIQRELKRVGCYAGEINGVWTPSTRRSMKAFTDRANAALPVEEPDHILLAMVANQRGKTCGPCPMGQVEAQEGRCVPEATIALDPRRAPLETQVQTAGPLPDPALEQSSERMALAGPNAEAGPPALEDPALAAAQKRPPAAPKKRRDWSAQRLPRWAAQAFGQ